MTYNSEHGQDKWLNENIFKGMRGGVFVEFGAIDGLLTSNSLFFEKELGWTGLCIEPNPSEFKKLRTNRNCACFNAAISDHFGLQHFTICNKVTGWSGLSEDMHKKHLERIRSAHAKEDIEVILVQCLKLEAALDIAGLNHIDYMTIDVEGAEHRILRAFPFGRFDISIFDIENNYGQNDIGELMLSRGYEKIISVGINDIYKRHQ
jgi:FkbM family methyltransferase